MDWNRKPVYGVGINDIFERTKGTKAYVIWKAMLSRCYSEKVQADNPAYRGCSVCEEWLTFSKFKEWFDENYRPGFQLDKDILLPGNRLYSPDSCCFVPQEINKLFRGHSGTKRVSTGVQRQFHKYRVQIRHGSSTIRKSFDTAEEAGQFYKAKLSEKLERIANQYLEDGLISRRVYESILSYAI